MIEDEWAEVRTYLTCTVVRASTTLNSSKAHGQPPRALTPNPTHPNLQMNPDPNLNPTLQVRNPNLHLNSTSPP